MQITDTDSHRAATKLLKEQGHNFYTYSTKEEAKLRVVIKGLPEHYSSEKIMEDLELQGFHPESVFKIKKNKKPLPMMLAILPREEKEIFNVRSVKRFIVRMEAQYPRASIGQCHRCQRFGHSQRHCNLPPKCVKCAENHLTSDCTTPANIPLIKEAHIQHHIEDAANFQNDPHPPVRKETTEATSM